ncbi:MAG: hypothetical protein Q8K92_08130 [Leadbetterella sp.]|nr:hypothetical protein [Leadbetterella sp.]
MSLKSKDFKKVMPLLMALRAYGRDFDAAAVLVERIWASAPLSHRASAATADRSARVLGSARTDNGTAQGDMAAVPFEEKLKYVAGLLAEINKRVIKVLWLWPSWLRLRSATGLRLPSAQLREHRSATGRKDREFRWLPTLVWVREEHFANTKAIELSMANVYFLRFAEAARKMVGPSTGTPAAPLVVTQDTIHSKRYEKCLAELLGHLVIRKRWNWRKMRLERTKYHSREVLRLGMVLMDGLDETTKLWLVNYFEEQLKLFVRMFPGVFGTSTAAADRSLSDQESEASKKHSHQEKGIFPNGQGWIAILEDVALQGAYGDFEKVCDTEAVTIWLFLEHQKIKAAAAE